jgi:hypothetical protein
VQTVKLIVSIFLNQIVCEQKMEEEEGKIQKEGKGERKINRNKAESN